MQTASQRINAAWNEEGSIGRLGLRPAPNREITDAIVPAGGEWACEAPEGCTTRSIMWGRTEVALVNPRGDLGDYVEGQIAMGLRATPAMDKALRAIFVLAGDADNLDLIKDIARAAIAYVEQPAPSIPGPEDDLDDEFDDERDYA